MKELLKCTRPSCGDLGKPSTKMHTTEAKGKINRVSENFARRAIGKFCQCCFPHRTGILDTDHFRRRGSSSLMYGSNSELVITKLDTPDAWPWEWTYDFDTLQI